MTHAYRALLPSELLGLMLLSDVLRSVSCSRLLNNEVVSTATDGVHGEIRLLVVLSRDLASLFGVVLRGYHIMLWTVGPCPILQSEGHELEYESTTTRWDNNPLQKAIAPYSLRK